MRDEKSRAALVELIDDTDLTDIVMLEVGSYAGESADTFASTGKVAKLLCIDPWRSGYDRNDIASRSNFTEVEQAFDKVMAKHNTVIHKFKGTLQEFVEHFPEIRPHVVYIDAEHTYEECSRDIETAKTLHPKWICGHDYCKGWSGVIKAVDNKLGKPDKVFPDNSWMKKMEKTEDEIK